MDVNKDLSKLPRQLEGSLPDNFSTVYAGVPWTRTAAAGSLVASALLLLGGKRKGALIVALGGAAVALFENPDAAREVWDNVPGYLRAGQDFLVKAESFLEKFSEQSDKFRSLINK